MVPPMRVNEQPYPVLSSHLELRGPTFESNREQNLKLMEPVLEALAKAREGGGARYTERHKARGKLLPRERIELLLDRDSPFLELCPLAGHGIDGHAPGASVIGGIGRVSGVIVGALIMGVLNIGLSIMGIGSEWQQVIKGLVLLAAVAFDLVNKRKSGGTVR